MTKARTALGRLQDGFANMLAGLGMANPQQAAHGYATAFMELDPAQLAAAYRGSTWFRKIVDIPVDDGVREWRHWQADKDQITALEKVENDLHVRAKVQEAWRLSRLYGGGAIIMGGLSGQPDQPIGKVGLGQLQYLTVLNKFQCTASTIITDPMNPDCGKPEYFNVSNVRIHPSRVVAFRGITAGEDVTGDWWGDSIWGGMRDAILNSDAAAAILGAMMVQAKRDIIRIPDLMGAMATVDAEQLLVKRFQVAATVSSVTGSLLLDKDDEFETKQLTWTGLSDIVYLMLTIMAGAADIPVTRLIGTSAKGLNATGEGDLTNYYDRIASEQELYVSEAIRGMTDVLIASALGSRIDSIWYDWAPLYLPSQKESADTNKTNAEADKIYNDSGLVPVQALAEAVRNRMIESGHYPGLDEAIAKLPAEALEADPRNEAEPEPDDVNNPDNVPPTADAAPRPLYVHRKVRNAAAIRKWATSQGFTGLVPDGDMHVTVLYSREAVDWLKMDSDWTEKPNGNITIKAGGPRVIERLGPDRVLALAFASTDLQWRHQSMISRGASHDWEDYTPHITFSKDPHDGIDLDTLQPYRGVIELGPEIFEALDE